MFRVAAVNAQGEGDFLQSVMPTVAKHAVDPPIQPDTPRIVDFDKTWVKLEWWAPSNSDIKHYIVEKRETFLVPKDVEGEAPPTEEGAEPEADEEAKAQEQQSAAVKAALGGGVVTAEPAQPVFTGEFIEYASKWMVALVTDDATPEVTIKDLGNMVNFQKKDGFFIKYIFKTPPQTFGKYIFTVNLDDTTNKYFKVCRLLLLQIGDNYPCTEPMPASPTGYETTILTYGKDGEYHPSDNTEPKAGQSANYEFMVCIFIAFLSISDNLI